MIAKIKSNSLLIDIPAKITFDCIIATPQFSGDKVIEWKVQKGTFSKSDFKFKCKWGFLGIGHDVQFKSLEDFQRSLLKIF